MNDNMKLYRYWGRPDGVVRHYDASTPQAAEESAHQILTLMQWDGRLREISANLEERGFEWGTESFERHSEMTFKQIQNISDPAERDLAMTAYEFNLYRMMEETAMSRVGFQPPSMSMVWVRKDEVNTTVWGAAVLKATEYQLRTADSGVMYRRVTFQELLEAVGGPWTRVSLDDLSVSDSEARFTVPKFGLELVW